MPDPVILVTDHCLLGTHRIQHGGHTYIIEGNRVTTVLPRGKKTIGESYGQSKDARP